LLAQISERVVLHRTPGLLDPWTPGPLDPWTPGPLDPWTPGLLDPWTPGPLELTPEVLIRDFVVELHLRGLDACAEGLRAAVRLRLFDVHVALVHFGTEQFRHELAAFEETDAVIDVVGQELGARAPRFGVLVSQRPFQSRAEQRVERQVRVGVRCNRPHLDTRRLLVAQRDAHHRAAVHRRRLDLVRRLVVRVEPAIGVDARIERQADLLATREDAVDEAPPGLCPFRALNSNLAEPELN